MIKRENRSTKSRSDKPASAGRRKKAQAPYASRRPERTERTERSEWSERTKQARSNRSGRPERAGRRPRPMDDAASERMARRPREAAWEGERSENLETPSPDLIFGRNAVREALKNERSLNKILVAESAHGGSLQEIISMARKTNLVINTVERKKLDLVTGTSHHQGIAAYTAPVPYAELDTVLAELGASNTVPFFVLLDEIEDPQNLGAIIRTADAAGAHAVIIPKRRSCPLSSTVAMTSAGAIEYVPVIRVNSLLATINSLKKQGFWVTGAEAEAQQNYYQADLKGPLLLVIGSEGKGISLQIQKACDFLVKIPMQGKVNSLNASNAAAILMYEAARQRGDK